VTPAKHANSGAEFGMRNRIINGAMMIDQRNAGASLSIAANSNAFSVDRFRCDAPVGQGITVQQVNPSLAGFSTSLLYTAGTASTNASDASEIFHAVEGFNVADMQWGTANAKAFTLSFWAKSSLTGSFGLVLEESTGGYQYFTTYSLPVANTWTYITLNIPAPTSGGTWLTNNGRGLVIRWDLGAGTSRSVAATNAWGSSSSYTGVSGTVKLTQTTGATFQLTGVQLEKGSTATPFDFRPYGTELALCQRYYQQIVNGSGAVMGPSSYFSSTRADGVMPLAVSMRGTPSFSISTGTNYYRAYLAGNSYNSTSVSYNGSSSNYSMLIFYNNGMTGLTNGAGWWESLSASAYIGVSAEL
jgi:hypothetical protein